MAVFLSTYVNKVDAKGRVSVPAEFRRILAGHPGVMVFKSLQHPALEACSAEHLEQLSESLESLDLPVDEYELIETTIFGGSVHLPFDPEGRVMLPEKLAKWAGISGAASFVGRRRTFQIWDPQRFDAYESEARDKARSKDISLSKIIAMAAQGRGGAGRSGGGAA